MRFETRTSPHLIPSHSVGGVMRQVLYALVPGTLAMTWFFGWGVLVNVMLAVLFAVGFEALMVALRRRPVGATLADSSAILAGWLFALAIPPLAPFWVLLTGTAFAIVVAKHLYGGLGYNPFNPAMVGYVVVLVSFPREISLWPAPEGLLHGSLTLLQTLQTSLTGRLPDGMEWDAITRASPLDLMRDGLVAGQTVGEVTRSPVFGSFSETGWEWTGNLFLLGGLWLLYRRVITWHIPAAMVLTLATTAGVFWVIDPDQFASPAFHVFSGAAIIGAFFIATDPVSAATTPLGRILYGAGIGLLTYVIRTWGGYPDAVAFAVLLMNMVAPTLDHYTRPRIFGHSRDRHG
ncbi:Electron transport complex protein RnfD [Thioalkalivibrio nitratireducens DSM 14787]|uniref:Ion-translocating oxidoreductase complex subunit D n=1 Tax=Thioalkalivibrio nitratireducens (strain DSM 14787 / UNIQEM 213 / ALEN2) TaxID=1255043 RepID=L0DYI6_THIND|nr:electron transport complex subunit RsxD [Thioalkalivibrio nitratireducens]AGA34025.1 Electron transport complex protein RnfD [Thioalkalivibrio nitratireducens DSM 14787]